MKVESHENIMLYSHALANQQGETPVLLLSIEQLHVTSSMETNVKVYVKFTSAWQTRLAYKHVPYSSHSLDFLYKLIPLHLVYTIAVLVSEET